MTNTLSKQERYQFLRKIWIQWLHHSTRKKWKSKNKYHNKTKTKKSLRKEHTLDDLILEMVLDWIQICNKKNIQNKNIYNSYINKIEINKKQYYRQFLESFCNFIFQNKLETNINGIKNKKYLSFTKFENEFVDWLKEYNQHIDPFGNINNSTLFSRKRGNGSTSTNGNGNRTLSHAYITMMQASSGTNGGANLNGGNEETRGDIDVDVDGESTGDIIQGMRRISRSNAHGIVGNKSIKSRLYYESSVKSMANVLTANMSVVNVANNHVDEIVENKQMDE